VIIFLSGLPRLFIVFAIDFFCDLAIFTSLFWYVNWFLRNYPLHLVLSLRSLNPHLRLLRQNILLLPLKLSSIANMAPSRKSVN